MSSGSKVRLLTQVQHEDREDESRPLSFALIRRLLTYTRPYARRRNLLIVTVIVRSAQLPLLAWLIARVVGGPVARMDVRGVMIGAAAYAGLALFTQFTLRYRSGLSLELGENVIFDLRNAMFTHLQSQPMSFFNRNRIGRIISRFTSDAEAVRTGVQEVLFVSIVAVGQMLVSGYLMIYYDWALFLVVLLIGPGLWLLNRYFRTRLSRMYRAVQESFSRVTAALAESVMGIRVTQGFVRQDFNAELFRELLEDHSRYNIDVARAAGVFVPLLEVHTQLFLAGVIVLGGWRVQLGAASVEDLYQFMLVSSMFFAPLQYLGTEYAQALTAMAGAERVFRLLDTEPAWSDGPDATDLTDMRGRIEFRDVSFAYEPDRPVLHNVSFAAEPGQVVALVGPTGGGKSTIMNLVGKFYLPGSGQIFVDGREIRSVTSRSLHRHMGIVLQQNFLFTGTVMDNIRFSRPEASDVEVEDAARKLDCHDLISALPEGFNTRVGERGSGISMGQRQLICFARAMLADPRVLILDEATSSVDTLTEMRVQRALAKLLANRTGLVVAHRLSTIRHADIVLVLDGGRIVERGTHTELLAADGPYTELYRQFISVERRNQER